jgi:membrane associated rhomboid family serine protease
VKELRRKFDRFIYNNRDMGIRNLMLIISVGTLLSYFIMLADSSGAFYSFICFDRYRILHGQIWRLFTYIFVPQSSGILLFLFLFAYYGIGRMVEQYWGTLKFNLFYLTGVLIVDAAALLMNQSASAYYLNLSLFLALATINPEGRVMLMYIIPLKMKYLAWVYLLLVLVEIVQLNFFPVFALMNYFLFFGSDCIGVLPESWQRAIRSKSFGKKKPNANWASAYQSSGSKKQRVVDAPAYRHKCAVCGRTDVSNPELEFRYCSKCHGYYCYCQDHINNHAHIQ